MRSVGTSNVVLTLNRVEGQMVLQPPPAVPPSGTEGGVLREALILTALNQSEVTHPHWYATCDDAGVIGHPFYAIDKIKGWAPHLHDEKMHNEPPFDRMPDEYGLALAVADGQLKLTNVD